MPPRDCLAAYCCACSGAATHSAAVAVLTRIRKHSEELQSGLHACLLVGSFVALAEYESVLVVTHVRTGTLLRNRGCRV
jgi:hypothetical protein